jgi:hypothetical protein
MYCTWFYNLMTYKSHKTRKLKGKLITESFPCCELLESFKAALENTFQIQPYSCLYSEGSLEVKVSVLEKKCSM